MIVKETAKLENAGHVPGQLLGVAELVQAAGVVVAGCSALGPGAGCSCACLPSGGSLLAE